MKKRFHLKSALLIAFLLLLASGAWIYYYHHAFVALPYNDAMDYAAMARNICKGRGFTSRYLTPLSLAHFGEPYPNIWRAPLWPLFLAGCFRAFGAADSVAAGAGGFFYVAAILPIFLLCKELAGKAPAFFACILYIFSPLALFYSLSGMTEPMALFFMVLWVYLLYKARKRASAFMLMTGAVAGLFYLTRYNAVIFLPFSCLYIWWSDETKKAGQKIALYLSSWLLTVFPWLLRNYLLTGNPFFSLQSYEPAMFTATYPAYTLYMLPQIIDVKAFILAHPREILSKIKDGVSAFCREILAPSFTGTTSFIAALFYPGLLNPEGIKLNLFILCCFFAQLAALLIVHYIPRLFFIFLPFYIIVAFSLLGKLLRNFAGPLLKHILLAAVTVAALHINPPHWHEGNSRQNWRQDYAAAISDVTAYISPEGVIVSNDGHILSWYSDRLALKMPVRWEQTEELEKMATIEGIWLSNRFRWGNTPEADKKWLEIMREQPRELGNYYLFTAYENGSLLYLKK